MAPVSRRPTGSPPHWTTEREREREKERERERSRKEGLRSCVEITCYECPAIDGQTKHKIAKVTSMRTISRQDPLTTLPFSWGNMATRSRDKFATGVCDNTCHLRSSATERSRCRLVSRKSTVLIFPRV